MKSQIDKIEYRRIVAPGVTLVCVILGCLLLSCQHTKNNAMNIDIQGHRGCRGLMPENTLPAFQKALEIGVNTLEMDLVISRDHQVVVSHEPYFRAGISRTPDGQTITPEEALQHNMYTMDYDSIKQYDVGTNPDPKHPNRQNIAAHKPLFREVVELTKSYCDAHQKPLPQFNIEIKRVADQDSIFHPDVNTFVDLVLHEVENLGIEKQVIIQSFDLPSLRITRQQNPQLRTALLIENKLSPAENVTALGFKPDIYSCDFTLVNDALIEYCKQKNIAVIPWTVNKAENIRAQLDYGVDGIISDYPDRVIKILDSYADN